MPLDLKVADIRPDAIHAITWPAADYVDGLYSLIQRVYRNLMTSPASDSLDSTWGSDLRGALYPIPGNALTEARTAVAGVLTKCQTDVAAATRLHPPEGRLDSLTLLDLWFDTGTTTWNLEIEITTPVSSVTLPIAA